MTTRRLEFTGIDARSGRRLSPPTSLEEIGRRAIVADQLDEKTLRLIADLLAGTAARDPKRAPSADVTDPADLEQTGWAVLFAPGTPREVEVALEPLTKLRRSQAKDRFKLYRGVAAESMYELFQGIDHPPGDVPDPEKLPYYVLLVGDPERIPYRVQVQLDIRYAVGRLHFPSVEEYARYAEAVVASELKVRPQRPRELSFFSVSHPGDAATERVAAELVAPLADALRRQRSDWSVRAITGERASRRALDSLVEHMPALLFAAGHGVRYDEGDEDQRARQGALVCSDWPGGESPLASEQMFAADDLPESADLSGSMAFLFSCYGAGTPEADSFEFDGWVGPRRIADKPFVARLPQRLLAAGALAVIGHVDRTWTSSFTWNGQGGHVRTYNDMLRLLMDGFPIGWAMETMNVKGADLAHSLHDLWQDRAFLRPYDLEVYGDLWLATNDARNFIVLGDPAVRLDVSAREQG